MGRRAGNPAEVVKIRLHVPEDWVIEEGGKRYVFMDLISTLVVAVTAHDGDKRMANRFWQLAHRGKYAVSELYGMEVLNIDSPNSMAVSLPLEIVVGNGKDTVREMKRRKV